MDVNKIIFLISFIILFLLFVSIPLRIEIVKKKSGKLVKKLAKKLSPKFILIYMMGFLLIVLSYMVGFSPLYQGILSACALLGEEYAMREFAFSGKNGLYEKGLISNGQFIQYSNITKIQRYNQTVLILFVFLKTNVNMFFEKEEECNDFLEKLKEFCPQITILENEDK